jgi:hypothetical protein
MREYKAPDSFSPRTKAGVGMLLAAVVGGGILYDPIIYTRIVAILTLFVAVAFPFVYRTLPWKQTILGRALMTKARAVALLYISGVVGFWWDYPLKTYILAAVTTYLAIGIGFQFVVLLRIKYVAAHTPTERTLRYGEPA